MHGTSCSSNDVVQLQKMYLRIFGGRVDADSMQTDNKAFFLGELADQCTGCVSAGKTCLNMARAYCESLHHHCFRRVRINLYTERMAQFPELSHASLVTLLLSKWKADSLGPDQDQLGRQLSVANYLVPPAPISSVYEGYQKQWAKSDQINRDIDLGFLKSTRLSTSCLH